MRRSSHPGRVLLQDDLAFTIEIYETTKGQLIQDVPVQFRERECLLKKIYEYARRDSMGTGKIGHKTASSTTGVLSRFKWRKRRVQASFGYND